jgi:hypothetical protein
MPLTSTCGPHCGIRANAEDTLAREGHCSCGDPCHPDGSPPAPPDRVIRQNGADVTMAQPTGLDGQLLRGTPMCARWYERAGDYRPWHYVRPSLVTVEHRPDISVMTVNPAAREGGGC